MCLSSPSSIVDCCVVLGVGFVGVELLILEGAQSVKTSRPLVFGLSLYGAESLSPR